MRDAVAALADGEFDVLVVGAGIHGAAAAWTAARLRLRTALLDQGDFGGATSANSLKVIHGGLRYLQHGNVRRMRESILARREFLALAPHLVRPQAFLMPTAPRGIRSRPALRVALAINDFVSLDRNQGLDDAHRLPGGRVLGAAEARAILPGLAPERVTGAALWHDALAENTERLTLSFALSAEASGATIANYTRACALRVEGGAVRGIEAEDAATGETLEVRARTVINAAGPWIERPWTGLTPRFPLVGAWNVVVRRPIFGAYGVGLESTQEHRDRDALVQRGKRNLFFVPWRGGTMIGTVYEPFAGDPAEYRPSRRAVQAFLDEINRVYPPAALGMDDVTFVQVGVQPAPEAVTEGSPEPDKHSEVIDAGSRGGPRGMFSIKGVKYTTGPGVGRRAARLAARSLGRMDAPPDELSLYGGEHVVTAEDVAEWAASRRLKLTAAAAKRLATQYGTRAEYVLDLACEDQAQPVPGLPDALLAEVRHALRFEHALRLADIFLRRTEWGSFSRPPPEAVRAVCDTMAKPLGWSAQQVEREERALLREYERVAE